MTQSDICGLYSFPDISVIPLLSGTSSQSAKYVNRATQEVNQDRFVIMQGRTQHNSVEQELRTHLVYSSLTMLWSIRISSWHTIDHVANSSTS
ncbi:hypothetical protein PILCRDRAFT_444283 [Piloderma croceum F 1598]|uniref:Uncharacterized protein n=1 Tax=Piloderma croceum (strain F 1598) TaxID=765440 RepID=A0A0C3FVF5_PILCF|nr:hypothetical protein PILCRDRAFT_444283 [Piloderma croceum F 1598]